MQSKLDLDIKRAFVVDSESLKKLCTLLSQRIGNCSITAKCADSLTREFGNVNSLLKYENSKEKRIIYLRIHAASAGYEKSASIRFRSEWIDPSIGIEIEAREDVVSNLRDDLEEVISGLIPWHSWINQMTPIVFLVFLC